MHPIKVSRTREKILRKGEKYADDLKEQMDELMDTVSNKFDQTRKEVAGYAEKVKGGVSDFADKTVSKAQEAEKNLKKSDL